ncbi:MAG: hypothetical protein HFE84_02855 [Lachnospiraceae bacterium]|jgi:hypothetical protein|nr:hypothetical protein [Lachnospiraceae bacterium]
MVNEKGKKEKSFSRHLTEGEKSVLEDAEHGSKAIVPIKIDEGNTVEIIQVDGGVIQGLPKNKRICDAMVYTVDCVHERMNLTWLIELKGSAKAREAQYSIKQLLESIGYMQDSSAYPQAEKYIKGRDYVFAAAAGAPDKTLPVVNSKNLKDLCKKLRALSGQRKNVKDMFMLFSYIQPDARKKKAGRRGDKPPYSIMCHNNSTGYIAYPSMLMELLNDKK